MGFFDKFKSKKVNNLTESIKNDFAAKEINEDDNYNNDNNLKITSETNILTPNSVKDPIEEETNNNPITDNDIKAINKMKKDAETNPVLCSNDIENTVNKEDIVNTKNQDVAENINNDISKTETKEEKKATRRRNTNNISSVKKDKEKAKKVFMMNLPDVDLDNENDLINEISRLNNIHISWRDYCLMMLNSTADPLRSIWREKIETSMEHWNFSKGSISEGNIAGIEILSVLPSELTEKLVDDHFEIDGWKKLDRLNGSKRMNVFVGHYGQESFSNEANICLKYLVKNWDKKISFADNMTGKEIIMKTPLLYSMWDLAQKSGGKCITDEEMLTYLLEKAVDDSKYGVWIGASNDIFTNGIPSEKYRKYWKSDKIDGYPLAYIDENGINIDSDCNENNNFYMRKYRNNDGALEIIALSLEEQKQNFLNMCDIYLKENVAWAACWKKICICILKNDVSMKYAGFSATLRERKAREDAMAAFSTKQEEKAKAKENAKALAAKIEKENKENNK